MSAGNGVVIGLTGGIASGKSTVSAMLKAFGAYVLDADAISRSATEQGTDCYTAIVDTFGCQVVEDGGTISRKALARIAFSDEEKRRVLNAIIHPYVLQCLQRDTAIALSHQASAVVWDVPLLLEVGWHRYVDCVIVVTADQQTRIRRVMKRDGATEEEARRRIFAQMPDVEKCALAHFVLVNQTNTERLRERVEQVYHSICSRHWEGEWHLH